MWVIFLVQLRGSFFFLFFFFEWGDSIHPAGHPDSVSFLGFILDINLCTSACCFGGIGGRRCASSQRIATGLRRHPFPRLRQAF